MEAEWAEQPANGRRVDIEINYPGNSRRPDSFTVTYRVDGGLPIVREFLNEAP